MKSYGSSEFAEECGDLPDLPEELTISRPLENSYLSQDLDMLSRPVHSTDEQVGHLWRERISEPQARAEKYHINNLSQIKD